MPERVEYEYFEWLLDHICRDRYTSQISYRQVLSKLHSTTFRYSILRDANRARDGEDLRLRFADERSLTEDEVMWLEGIGPCSVLEMMIALSIRCEEHIMDNPNVGDRTRQWFWSMMVSLGLGSVMDHIYDERYVEDVINRFLDREYEPNGKGGLFTINDCNDDLRNAEIWYQLCWYLGTMT